MRAFEPSAGSAAPSEAPATKESIVTIHVRPFIFLLPAETRTPEQKTDTNRDFRVRIGEQFQGRSVLADSVGEVSVLLAEMRSGRNDALGRLLPLVYNELRRLAGRYMRDERRGHTLQPTALVHEAYLRLAGQDRANWQNRAQFMGIAGQLMRRLLVDHARKRHAAKRGGSMVTLDEGLAKPGAGFAEPEEILSVDEALTKLEQLDTQQSRVVELRYFGGLSPEETAEAMGISQRTVEREWAFAKAWLRAQLADREPA
ncbi:MAG: sigma-70 family RNA polymerase sigma factor [Acidobacteriota bacterium]|nr:sigma-70 family RNA polymerase sigma factor [Acidobacteriota bacterium]